MGEKLEREALFRQAFLMVRPQVTRAYGTSPLPLLPQASIPFFPVFGKNLNRWKQTDASKKPFTLFSCWLLWLPERLRCLFYYKLQVHLVILNFGKTLRI